MLKLTVRRLPRPEPVMRHVAVEFEVPEALFQKLHGEKGVTRRFRERIALDLLESGLISHERAADMLGISPFDLLDLMQRRHVPYFTGSDEEFARDLEVARSLKSDLTV